MVARFYQPNALIQGINVGDTLTLSSDVQAHAIKVLRMNMNDELILFSGMGGEVLCKITQTKPKGLVEVLSINDENKSSPINIHLGQGIARGDKMDFIIQKAVELGCSRITPLITQKSQVKLDEQRKQKRFLHWQKIIISAAEQSGLNILPILEAPCNVEDWIQQEKTQGFVFHPEDNLKLKANLSETKVKPATLESEHLRVLIGSESGLTNEEAQFALEHGFSLASLGPRILRTETATITAISLIQSYFGDLPRFN